MIGDPRTPETGTPPHDSSSAASRDLPVRTATNPALGHEPEEQKTIGEVIRGFTERRHTIDVMKVARILFDPKQLPGVTTEEALDFFLKGLRIDDPKIRKMFSGESGMDIRGDFPEFIEGMHQQNSDRTAAEIWRATGADSITKMALQWEIQQPIGKQFNDEAIEKHAGKVAKDLKKLDTLLRGLNGVEILLLQDREGFIGLTTADGKGIDFVRSDPSSPYRDIALGNKAASRKYSKYNRADRLVIPFEDKDILRTIDPKDWDRAGEIYGGRPFYRLPFDPANPFPAIIVGEDLPRLRKDDTFFKNTYDALKKTMEQSASGPIVKT